MVRLSDDVHVQNAMPLSANDGRRTSMGLLLFPMR